VLLLQGCLALVYYRERIFMDSAHYLMRVLSEGAFWVEHQRLVLVLAEWPALLASTLGIGLKGVLVAHSVGNWLNFYLIFILIAHWQRQLWVGLAWAATCVLGMAYGFFCPIYEFYYGVGLLLLWFSIWHTQLQFSWPRALGLAALLGVALSAHLNVLVLLVLLLLLSHSPHRSAKWLWAMGAVAVLYALSKWLWAGEYEQMQAGFVREIYTLRFIGKVFKPSYLVSAAGYSLTYYADVLALAGLGVAFAWHRRAMGLRLFALGLLGAYILIHTYHPGSNPSRYREQVNFLATSWVCVWAFVAVAPYLRGKQLRGLLFLLALCGVYRLGLLIHTGETVFRPRRLNIELLADCARSQGVRKALVPYPDSETPYDHDSYLQWSLPQESLLLSALEGSSQSVQLLTRTDSAHLSLGPRFQRFVFRRWEVYPTSQYLNGSYFLLPDSQPYTLVHCPPVAF
jgi:hypothetical protein